TGNGPKIILTTSVSGILPVANGGTGLSSLASFVTLTGTQTLTNKTLTSPTISSPTISGTVTGAAFWTSAQNYTIGNATTASTYVVYRPTDYGTGKPQIYLSKSAIADKWNWTL